MTRRDCLFAGGAALMATTSGRVATASDTTSPGPMNNPFRYCLNTSTIRGQNLSLVEEIELVAKVGFRGIEPWIREIEQYRDQGGSLLDLGKRISDLGLTVESAIGFPAWAVDDEGERKRGLETFQRDAELLKQIGGTRIAAPPVGINRTGQPRSDLFALAERYAALLKIGRDLGITPMVEIWGPSANLSRLGEAVFVAVESGDADACLLLDIYHIYRGGSGFEGLKLLDGGAIPVFHVNDYPTDRERTTLNDSDRVHVGDGGAPTDFIFRTLASNGSQAALSLELFNPTYWEQPAEQVLRDGLAKITATVERALA